MSARIVVNGRTVVGTGKRFVPLMRNAYDTERPAAPMTVLPNGGVPTAGEYTSAPSNVWVDTDGTRYRVIRKFESDGRWVGAAVIMRWFGIEHRDVIALVLRGVLDGAVEQGSVAKHYRVIDVRKVEAAAKEIVNKRMEVMRSKRPAKRSAK